MYTYDTINVSIMPKVLQFSMAKLFRNMGYLADHLWNNAKVEKINMFEVPLQFASDANPQGLTPLRDLEATHGEILTKGYDSMAMMGDLATITYEEGASETGISGDRAMNLMRLRVEGKLQGVKNAFVGSIWRASSASATSTTAKNQTNSMYDVFNQSGSLHNISPTTYTYWKTYNLDASGLGGTISRAGIKDDSSSPVFVEAIINRTIAYLKSRGCMPKDCVIQLASDDYDIFRQILRTQDRLNPGPLAAKLGYDSVVYRQFEVVEDDNMVDYQSSSNTAGIVPGLHLPDLDLYVNSPQKVAVGNWRYGGKQTYAMAQMLFYRQLCCHDRSKQHLTYNYWNAYGYVPSAQES